MRLCSACRKPHLHQKDGLTLEKTCLQKEIDLGTVSEVSTLQLRNQATAKYSYFSPHFYNHLNARQVHFNESNPH